jgi:DNA polymerase-3 subunit delta'
VALDAPAVLDAIDGQAEAVELLRRALEGGRVAHAWAFIGPHGAGRRTSALAFAKALVAPSGGAAASRVDRGLHPDVHLLGPTPPASNPKGTPAIRVENIRELERLASLKPAEAPWKVFIVDEAESMTGAAPQAFLKTLEEPPARTVIILVLSQARALPATVLSRCQIVRFRPRAAEGAVALLPGGAGEDRERALGWLAQAQTGGVEAILRIGEAVGRDRKAALAAVETCWLWYRDLLCAQGGADSRLAVFGDAVRAAGRRGAGAPPSEASEIQDRAAGRRGAGAPPSEASEIQRPDGGRRSLDEVVMGLSACREAWQAIQGNVSPRLTVEVLLSRLTKAA